MTYTAKQMHEMIGDRGTIRHGELRIAVVIVDAKVSYATPRLLVRPLAGSGETWINADTLTLDAAAPVRERDITPRQAQLR